MGVNLVRVPAVASFTLSPERQRHAWKKWTDRQRASCGSVAALQKYRDKVRFIDKTSGHRPFHLVHLIKLYWLLLAAYSFCCEIYLFVSNMPRMVERPVQQSLISEA